VAIIKVFNEFKAITKATYAAFAITFDIHKDYHKMWV